MHVLMTRTAFGAEARRPVENEWISDATFVGIALESLQRCVAGPGPSPRVVVVGLRCAEVVNSFEVLLNALGNEVEEVLLVERPLRTPLCRCAVVTHHDDNGVVRLVELLNDVEDACDLRIGMREEAGIDLHEPGGESLLVTAQRVPGRDPGGAFGELGAGRQEARRRLPGEHPLSPAVPSLVEGAAIALDVLGWCLVRSVAGARREPQEERPRG